MAQPITSQCVARLALLAALHAAAAPVGAQGVAGAAIAGRVLDADSAPVVAAVVQVANASNGERWRTTTTSSGRYFLEYLSIGGPYRVEVLAVGYEPARRDSIVLALGQRITADFTLHPAVLELGEITVLVEDQGLTAGTGPTQVIPDSIIARLPIRNRDYTSLARLSPQVTTSTNGGLSFAGQHDRYNGIRIDGTTNADPFGYSFSGAGTPGWAVGLTAFTPEAVEELQIVSAPFDVRFGGFAGGLINAVTRSGSNRLEGSISGYRESAGLTGTDATGARAVDFEHQEVILTLGAPIVRDRAAVFVNAALGRETAPQSVPVPPPSGGQSGIAYADLARFQELLTANGAGAGSFSAGATHLPTSNLFVKLTAQPGVNSRLAVSHNHGHGSVRNEFGERALDFYALSSWGTEDRETIDATRLAWTTSLGTRLSNQLSVARVADRRICRPNATFPEVVVSTDSGRLVAGSRPGCGRREAGHTIWELTDDLGLAAGSHALTFGVHGERIHLTENVSLNAAGSWEFESLEALDLKQPARYIRDFLSAGDSRVAFRIDQIGAYLQDQWPATPRLTLTAGLRLDIPFVATAPTRHAATESLLGINTSLAPRGNALWSPRVGASYDVGGRGATIVRGGAGLFAGDPAYVWFRNVYGTTGIRSLAITCTDGAVPSFTLDPGDQPERCDGEEEAPPPVAYFDPALRFPQTLKVAVGLDHRLPAGMLGTLDLLYSRGVHSIAVVDVNLTGPMGRAAGEGGRTLYGTFDSTTGEAFPARIAEELGGVYQLRNTSGERSYSITTALVKRFGSWAELSAAYTYTDARDRTSMDGNRAELNIGTPVNGTLERRTLATSFWERPHKVTAVATADLPLGFRLGLTYVGTSGAPFTFVALGDADADGTRAQGEASNDVVYVPRDAADIALADPAQFGALNRLIRNEPCLRRHRGRLLERNSCRDPWVHDAQVRLTKRFRLQGRRTLELTADLFNLLNFVDGDWGLVRSTSTDEGRVVPLLELLGYDTARGRGIYDLLEIHPREVELDASRWRLQLGGTLLY